VFVDNLPGNLDKYGLRGIFQRAGYVSDSYIPSKLGRRRKRFGFVRFWSEAETENSISRLNGITIRGFRIRVCRARFGKKELGVIDNVAPKQELKSKPRNRWRDKSISADRSDYRKSEVVATMNGELNEVFLEWLNKSLICVSEVAWDLEVLNQALVKDGCSKIRSLSKYKFVLTYQTREQKEEVFKNQVNLANWFHEVKNWDIYEVCKIRRFWVEVFGVPPHGWSMRNFERIVSFWGKLVCLETPIEDTISFESMKILVESNSFQEVMGHLILQIGDAGYRIMVKEASCSFVINPQFIAPESSSSTGVKKVNEVSSGPDHYGDMASKNTGGFIQGIQPSRLVCTNPDEVTRGAPLFEFETEVGQCDENDASINSMSKTASSKTKTAQLSGNGYSEEVAKIYSSMPAHKAKELVNLSVPGSINYQEGLNSGTIEEGNGESLFPPGFEDINATEGSFTWKGKKQQKPLAVPGKRITRSQAKRSKETGVCQQAISSKNGPDTGEKEGKHHVGKDVSNSDSITKLVKESFEVGELLGLRIIGNKDEAIRSFADRLRRERDSGR